MWMILCFVPLSTQTMHIMYQLIIPYTSLAVVAVTTPDTSDLAMWMEIPFFFFMHYALIGYVIYFLRYGRISVLPYGKDGIVSNFVKWWTLACAYFGLFYFGVATPLSLKLGLNLNYMLSPPPTPGDMVSGPNFRLQSTLCCAAAFFFVQFLVTAVEVFGRVVVRKESKKSV
jgi:vacuolar-type H+-ATPase subunit I/STV1